MVSDFIKSAQLDAIAAVSVPNIFATSFFALGVRYFQQSAPLCGDQALPMRLFGMVNKRTSQ